MTDDGGGGRRQASLPPSFAPSSPIAETSEKFFNLSGPDGDIVKGRVEKKKKMRRRTRDDNTSCQQKQRSSLEDLFSRGGVLSGMPMRPTFIVHGSTAEPIRCEQIH